jgi:hypothetical protein
MRQFSLTVVLMTVFVVGTMAPAEAQLTSPQIGSQATLSRIAHNVSGTVTIVDENTIQVDDFTYDGGGLSVYFYLGQADTRQSFLSGLQIGPQLLGRAFNGNGPPLVIDLPAGQTLQGWNAVSVWCVTVGMSFGSGTFVAVSPPLTGDYNGNGAVDAADYVVWRDTLGQNGNGMAADGNGNLAVDGGDYDVWRAHLGQSSGGSAVASIIPEPATSWFVCSMLLALVIVGMGRRPRCTENLS